MFANTKAVAAVVTLSLMLPLSAAADSDDYEICRDRARDISGYYGPVPAEYEEDGGALKGALAGAATGAALAWITDGDREDAAKKGAALGALIGALKKAEQDKKRRENERKRRRYEVELHACMSERRSKDD